MTKNEITKVVENIKQLESMAEEIKRELKKERERVSTFMNENNTKKYIGVNFTITISEYERKTLDKASLIADFGSLEDYEKVSLCSRLLIK